MNVWRQSEIDLCKKRIREGYTDKQIEERMGWSYSRVRGWRKKVEKEDMEKFNGTFSAMNTHFK